ncbi:2OG-Fe(II) oxygenase [Iningainema tapete]|uniref:2OG-Fe(II) oxygenase n=1 Tax=Iningainema tapete BLCC-T55 TaxID=2748662 RepID=A0A8J7CE12_9CYAN|nr:2OG-Fe(II) oxygenase [Iningainema tapete]MBD2773175.1 2OG-Fe(II) oxygenase [Iningainema tapete BLCC-T55]
MFTNKYPVFILDNFLSESDNHKLIRETIDKSASFIQKTNDPKYPKQLGWGSQQGFELWKSNIAGNIITYMREVLTELKILSLNFGEIEISHNAYQNQGFLSIHEDKSYRRSRKITFVYYYHIIPKSFTGGQLLVYQSSDLSDINTYSVPALIVEPLNNRCVFFASEAYHEVLPVKCEDFKSSRFSFSGWINEA